ncbi:putative membrane protein [Caldisphaera lagunensis DSM 15908]|uniref:Putative membrane protein n=1 Tax=Caldisphaera lagunensis (strain DSM 15908 / JCM 11604 / ANMR 0165 / IC-154) TaxID=1056495 RepID=L0AAK3_CALLD|nr:DoxX family protein [Caldisphaera lagunensis]AFZ70948.1 putative membrane protein [Caldisphaera lagunensis DSM 15908]
MITYLFEASIGILLVRLIMGINMIGHGSVKFKDLKGTAKYMKGAGVPEGLTYATALLELVGGIALVLGFLTRLASLLFFLQFLIIILYVKITRMKSPYLMITNPAAAEIDTIYMIISLALLISGPGIYSVDYLLKNYLLNGLL